MTAQLKITNDHYQEIVKAISLLPKYAVYVGVPEATTARDGHVTNAMLAYVHEFGSPARNIPARPFLFPAIRKKRDRIIARLKQAGIAATNGKIGVIGAQFEAIGIEVSTEAKNVISGGIPPPLKDATIKNRWRGRGKGYKPAMRPSEAEYMRQRGLGVLPEGRAGAGMYKGQLMTTILGEAGLITPLINTGAMQTSITYIVEAP